MKYKVGDRVAFLSRSTFCLVVGRSHKIGYIKQIRKTLFGIRYVICVAKTGDIKIVSERNIFHKMDKKESRDYGTVNKE